MIPAAIILWLSVTSCHDLFKEGLQECSADYRLRFSYTLNVLNADAFASQVSVIHLYAYDESGKLVWSATETRQLSDINDFEMKVKLPKGRYSLYAWCEGKSPDEDCIQFQINGCQAGDYYTETTASFNPLNNGKGSLYINKDLTPLFYGHLDNIEIEEYTIEPVQLPVMKLTKDTNHISVTLQQIDGLQIDSELFTFSLEGNNNILNWKNIPSDNSAKFDYLPCFIRSLTTSSDTNIISGVQTIFSTGRLMEDKEQILTVREKETGREVLRIGLIECLMLVRNKYQYATSSQDYLDRCDDYSIVFFIGEGYEWIKTKIFINGWRVVPPQSSEL